MDAQIFGRVGKGLLQVFYKHQTSRTQGQVNLEASIRPVIQWLKDCSPRQLSPALDRKAIHVFTDGACEEQSNGALLVHAGLS